MSDRQATASPSRLGGAIALGAVFGALVVYCWLSLAQPWTGAGATGALLVTAWLVGREPARRRAGVAVLASAVAVGVLLFVVLVLFAAAVGS